MNPVRSAIHSALSGSTAITSRLASSSSIYHALAPSGADYPYVIFHKQSGSPTYAFGAEAMRAEVWLVKCVDRHPANTQASSSVAEDVQAAIDAALSLQNLSAPGVSVLDVRRVSDVDYLESQGDVQYRHHGGLFRVTVG